ncbi:MAG: head GIN domain-containing protein [Flavobacteriaceae bacterium]
MFRPYFFLLIIVFYVGQAQEREETFEREVNLREFINLKVYSGIEVKLIPSQENKVIVSGADRMDVVAKIKGHTLKIRHSLEHLLNPTFTYVELYHSEDLDEISLYQGTHLKADSTYRQTSISLKVQEGSSMTFKFDGEKLSSVVNTGGKLFLSGKVTNHQSVVSSGGSCEAETFETEQTKVSVTAGGLAYVNATQLLEAKVTAGGIIRIYGNPRKMITKKTIGGQIFEMK